MVGEEMAGGVLDWFVIHDGEEGHQSQAHGRRSPPLETADAAENVRKQADLQPTSRQDRRPITRRTA